VRAAVRLPCRSLLSKGAATFAENERAAGSCKQSEQAPPRASDFSPKSPQPLLPTARRTGSRSSGMKEVRARLAACHGGAIPLMDCESSGHWPSIRNLNRCRATNARATELRAHRVRSMSVSHVDTPISRPSEQPRVRVCGEIA
jgi:hypothetical protein